MRRDEVLELLARHADELRGMGVVWLALFGSVARGEAREGSDVDLLVDLERPAGYLKIAAVSRRLEEILGCPVDLVPRKALRPDLRSQVLAEAIRAA